MHLCKKCEKEEKDNELSWLFNTVFGDGVCDKHGRFSFYRNNLKEHCYKCAVEKNICQICGEIVK